ncbi:hypothetical protein OG871_40345 (plasmid) [Kitasatospora sp. NBC_00374]|uniref:ParB/RepB/Spo0J family partition protein n=1 Tax=Kitasatospora sp. NBC_00374 TaxID=2975964 RepID=UPI002F9147CA
MTTIANAPLPETRTANGLRFRSMGHHQYLDPRILVLDEYNVRTEDAEPDQAMLDSVEADGVGVSLLVRPRGDGTYGVLTGQLRMLSAQAAAKKCIDEGREDDIVAVPCWIRDDLEDQTPEKIATAIAKSLQENVLRKAMTSSDVARAAEQLDLLGLSERELKKAATTAGLTVEQIKGAHRATSLPSEVRKQAAQYEFDLEEQIALAEVADVPDAMNELKRARKEDAKSGSTDKGNWKHAMQRLLKEKEEIAAQNALRAEWTSKGLKEVRYRSWYEPGSQDRMLSDLLGPDGKPIDPEKHSAECPGKAFAFHWSGELVFGCADWRTNGHKRADLARSSKPEGPGPAEVARKNKDEENARVVRGKFVKQLVQAKLSDAAVVLAMQVVTEMPLWYADAVSPGNAELLAALFDEPCAPSSKRARGFFNALNARLRRNRRNFNAVFAQVAMGFELHMSRKKHWAVADGWTADWLRFLQAQGYALSAIEKEMVAAVEKKEKAEAKAATARKPKQPRTEEPEQRDGAGQVEDDPAEQDQPDVPVSAPGGGGTDVEGAEEAESLEGSQVEESEPEEA